MSPLTGRRAGQRLSRRPGTLLLEESSAGEIRCTALTGSSGEQSADASKARPPRPSPQGPAGDGAGVGAARTAAGEAETALAPRTLALTMARCADIPRAPRASAQRLSRDAGASAGSGPPERLPDQATDLRWPGTDKGHSGAAEARPPCSVSASHWLILRLAHPKEQNAGLAVSDGRQHQFVRPSSKKKKEKIIK